MPWQTYAREEWCRMRIGLLTQWYDPEPGPASLPGALARGLVARGHTVKVVTGFPNYPTGEIAAGYRIRPRTVEHLDGVDVTRVALYPSHGDSIRSRVMNYGSFGVSAALLGVQKAFTDIDALWVNYSPVTIAAPLLAQAWLRRTPSVVHVLDLWPDTLLATGFAEPSWPWRVTSTGLHILCNTMYRTASKVAYISPGVGERLCARGVPKTKLAYAPMWANEEVFYPQARSSDHGFEFEPQDRVLLYAGTLGRAQGLEPLVRAAARLRSSGLVCLIAGSGTEERRLRNLATDVGATNVRFLGRVAPADMPALMAAADANYVSLNDDPLGEITMPSKLQATLAAGGAIVGMLSGDARDVVAKSGSGWVCKPGDEDGLLEVLAKFIAEPSTAVSARGLAGRAYYEEHFAFERGVQRIESLLAEAAGARP